MDFKNIDVCPVLETVGKFNVFHGYRNWINLTFPGLVHRCPYKDLLINNASYHIPTEDDKKYMQAFPNGMIKSL